MPSVLRCRPPFFLCAGLCLLFATVAWFAADGKSATMDEPSHAVTGWFNLWQQDYRMSPDVPPLWENWIALPMGPHGLVFDPGAPAYQNLRIRRDLTAYHLDALYHTPGVNGESIVRQARAMCLILGVALAALIAYWAWELAGPVAAVVAAFVYCLDPNFLGHAALVKNDVAVTLAYLGAAYAIWRAGTCLTWLSAIAVVAVSIGAVLIKFSGLLVGPLMLILLGLRAVDRHPWIVLGRSITHRGQKAGVSLLLFLAIIVIGYFSLWAIYDFRFEAGPNGLQLDPTPFVDVLRDVQEFQGDHSTADSPNGLPASDDWQPPVMTNVLLFAEARRLLPQAWIDGFIMTQSGSVTRLCFLHGQFYNGGKWYFFPLCALYKAPLATLIALVFAAWIGVRQLRGNSIESARYRWSAIVLLLSAGLYGLVAITSNVNVGLRHAFPVYPFVFIGIGLAAAQVWASKPARWMLCVLAIGLAAETAAAFPNYINFIGIASGGQSAGFDLVSDSNLDWGQDLPALANWQREHPTELLYLDYFGRCDPAIYGIRYVNLPGGYEYGPPPALPGLPGVIAVSSSHLRLLEAYDKPPAWFDLIKNRKPMAVLNGTIYLFDVNPK